MFYKILIAEVTCQGDGKMSYNVLRVSEVAEGDLGEGVARTRYTLLAEVTYPVPSDHRNSSRSDPWW